MNEKTKNELSGITTFLLRLITPVVGVLSLWILTDMNAKVTEIGNRLYLHQTNHEIHIPRGEIIEIKSEMREQMREIISIIKEKKTG